MRYPFISIIIPTYNEERNLPRLLDSIARLRYPASRRELIIVDGYSTDGTVTIAKKYGARIVFNKARIRGAGCQIGVSFSRGQYIAFTDADCTVPQNWLEGLLRSFTDASVVSVGGPNVTPRNDTPFAKAAGRVLSFLTMPGARYGARSHTVAKTFHNPGCNVVYKKNAIQKVGGFNTRLLTCEDEELDFRLQSAGYTHIYTPRVIVTHYRRPTYMRICVQSYRFAYGRAQAIRLHPRMARWFHFAPLAIAVLILISFKFTPFVLAGAILVTIVFSLALWVKYDDVPWYTYCGILYCWNIGWALGFAGGFAGKGIEPDHIYE